MIAAASMLLLPTAAFAGSVTITRDANPQFGSFVVIGSGSRQVSRSGDRTDSNVYPVRGAMVAPGRFELVYTPAQGEPGDATIRIEAIAMPLDQGGLSAKLERLDTDLQGGFDSNGVAMLSLSGCQPSCRVPFTIGGTLTVTRGESASGAINLPLTVRVSVDSQP